MGLRRKHKFTSISEYQKILYMNDNIKERIDNINHLIIPDKVVFHNMRPPMGKGNF